MPTDQDAGGGTRPARGTRSRFLAIAGVCVVLAAGWMAYAMRRVDQAAALQRAQLEERSVQVATKLNEHVSTLWNDYNVLITDTAWTGSIPRRLVEHPLVKSARRIPTISRSVQSPFGGYTLDNWTWVFQGPRDTFWVVIDPVSLGRAVENIDPEYEFRGGAPIPGAEPYAFDPLPVAPRAQLEEQIESDRRRGLLMHGAAAILCLLLSIGAAYWRHRSVPGNA